jgi:hypothetical protein
MKTIMRKEHMPEKLRYLGPEDDDTGQEETKEIKTYFLDGKIISLWRGSETSTVTIRPYQGSPELLSDDSIDSSSSGNTQIIVASGLTEGKKEGDAIQIGGIMRTEKGLITKEAYEILYPKNNTYETA